MQRTPLYLYLEKMAQGDEGFAERLCQQLADRLIYVPILNGPEGGSGQLKVHVVRLDEGESERVPIFTTEKLYKSWAVIHREKTKFISLLGGDFCAALKPHVSVVIDPGAVHSVVLKPLNVAKVASSTPEEIGSALPAPAATTVPENLRGRSEPTSFMQRPKSFAAAEGDPESVQGGGSPFGTGFTAGAFAAGTGDIKEVRPVQPKRAGEADENPAKQAHSFDRPVIFSPDTDSNRVVREKEDPLKKKRRSFLKFLTGS